ncbi:16S rRNA (uracil(1498)-N(3))-methyltransferase [Paenibacillus lutrae]|uniref:Ribosomal RNA small subunit methyltransferase E n=1 Tax=Paenibacillus lutrae TaxID=2078573 RepID=A0A7X3JZ08_9BACL|nr:16S rRNA (uracil(1498)-N(3))-methyltransferase [Paenibacillus lutrae]MVO99465.1 16S rRNA (uracil(1498)-N(3))-methyltransferase [Paenibacillus lutrae]
MQRYFVPAENFGEDTVQITGDDAHHLARVMRAEEGDRCICSDGVGREVLVEVTAVDKNKVEAKIVEILAMTAEPAVEVWIAQSLPKGDKMETVIQKGTEIGAARFLPFVSGRTVVQYDAKKEAKRTERWSKIAKEAAEQAHRNRVPAIDPVLSWKNLLQLAAETSGAWICYEKEDGFGIGTAIRRYFDDARAESSGEAVHSVRVSGGQEAGLIAEAPARLLLIIGPEGGFSEQEIKEAEAAGCVSVSLGRRILRTETAAMVGLTCILYESGEMGG